LPSEGDLLRILHRLGEPASAEEVWRAARPQPNLKTVRAALMRMSGEAFGWLLEAELAQPGGGWPVPVYALTPRGDGMLKAFLAAEAAQQADDGLAGERALPGRPARSRP
jgi:hypothetical protein